MDRGKGERRVVEGPSAVAGGSSGKAGGLLQIEAEPTCISPLSFRLHAQLAEEHDGQNRWGYRRVCVGETDLRGRGSNGCATIYRSLLGWVLPSSVRIFKEVGTPEDLAQVNPYQFTTSMAEMAEDKGVKILHGTALDIRRGSTEQAEAKGVIYSRAGSSDPSLLPATDVVVAAVPWTSSVMPFVPIGGAKSHSVEVQPSKPISNNCLWATIEPGSSGVPCRSINLEMYPRLDGTLYLCNWADPDAASRRCDALGSVSDELRHAKILVKQACHQPVILKEGRRAKNSGPLLGPTGVKGVLLAAGHDSWGVQNSPATGLLISDIIFEGRAKSADITTLDPRTILQESLLA